eukprot:9504011-Pyramimonas_sp.AAC.3
MVGAANGTRSLEGSEAPLLQLECELLAARLDDTAVLHDVHKVRLDVVQQPLRSTPPHTCVRCHSRYLGFVMPVLITPRAHITPAQSNSSSFSILESQTTERKSALSDPACHELLSYALSPFGNSTVP